MQRLGSHTIDMGRGWFSWIDVKHLRGSTHVNPLDALDRLIRCLHFRDIYILGDTHETDPAPLHGPYLLSAVSVDSYDDVGREDAEKQIRAFVSEREMPAENEGTLVDLVLHPVRRSGSVFRLRDLGEAAMHDFGGILDPFHELVAVDETGSRVTLIVMGSD